MTGAAHHDGTVISRLGKALDQRQLGVGTGAAYLDFDPMTGAADMGIAEAMIR
jgi:hypothetical protein